MHLPPARQRPRLPPPQQQQQQRQQQTRAPRRQRAAAAQPAGARPRRLTRPRRRRGCHRSCRRCSACAAPTFGCCSWCCASAWEPVRRGRSREGGGVGSSLPPPSCQAAAHLWCPFPFSPAAGLTLVNNLSQLVKALTSGASALEVTPVLVSVFSVCNCAGAPPRQQQHAVCWCMRCAPCKELHALVLPLSRTTMAISLRLAGLLPAAPPLPRTAPTLGSSPHLSFL